MTQSVEEIKQITKEAQQKIEKAETVGDLEELRIDFLGKKGAVTRLTKNLANIPTEERKEIGQELNKAKAAIEQSWEKKKDSVVSQSRHLESRLDITIPGTKPKVGHLHPVTQAIHEIEDIFHRLGFARRRYPEVESDWYAFESLNILKDHPARDTMETFYVSRDQKSEVGNQNPTSDLRPLTSEVVLSPHTSSGQVREIERGELPIRMVNIAKCYRRESDIGHTPTFHQFEGLLIDQNISIADLKGVFDYFFANFFGPGRVSRLRPYDFRFTEPSFEVDVSCGVCGGSGCLPNGQDCRLCKGGWVELGGAGMVHPQVIRNGGMDPDKVNGFAFGWGVERTWMMKAGIQLPDIRMIYSTDLRFLNQF